MSYNDPWKHHCRFSSISFVFPGLSLSTSDKLFRVTELSPLLYSLLTLSIGGSLAFGLGFSEFLLVSRTSSLTLSISGIFKVPCSSVVWLHFWIIHLTAEFVIFVCSYMLNYTRILCLKKFSSSAIIKDLHTLKLSAFVLYPTTSVVCSVKSITSL